MAFARPSLEGGPPLIPEHAHEREDEVRLIQILALGIDVDEHLGDLPLRDVRLQLQRGELVRLEPFEAAERAGDGLLVGPLDRLGGAQTCQEVVDHGEGRRGPDLTDVVEKGRVVVRGGVGDGERRVPRPKRNANALLLKVLPEDGPSLHDGEQRCEPLLPVDDEDARRELLADSADLLRPRFRAALPEQEVADGIAAVHGVEEISNLRGLPDERPLNVREPDTAEVDVIDQRSELVLNLGEDGLRHSSPPQGLLARGCVRTPPPGDRLAADCEFARNVGAARGFHVT